MEKLWGYPAPVKEASPELTPHSDAVLRPAKAASEKSPVIYRLLRRTRPWPELVRVCFCSLVLSICGISAAKVEYAQKGAISLRDRPFLSYSLHSNVMDCYSVWQD